MSESPTMTQPRRVTVVAPETRIDLALPAQATVGEVVQQIVALLGEERRSSDEPDAWTLGRIGEPPLEPAGSVLTSDIRDGDVLQLCDHPSSQTAAIFDDVIDAVAAASRTSADRWTADATRLAGLVGTSLALLGGAVATATVDQATTLAAGLSGAVAVVLLVAAAGLSRALGDATAGFACAVPALAFAFAAASLPVSGTWPGSLVRADALVVGGAAVAVTSLVGGLAVGRFRSVFAAGAAVGTCASLAATTQVLFLLRPVSVAAVVAALAVTAMTWLPLLSVRLARLPRPVIPADMAEFRQDELPTSGASMMDGARRGGRVLTWLLLTCTVVVSGCVVVLLRDGDRWALLLAAVLVVALMLRARRMPGVSQRLVLIAPGVLGAVALVAVALADAPEVWRLIVAVATLAVGALLVLLAVQAHRRRGATPYVARLVDLVEFLVLASIVPLAVAVLGLYSRLRGSGG